MRLGGGTGSRLRLDVYAGLVTDDMDAAERVDEAVSLARADSSRTAEVLKLAPSSASNGCHAVMLRTRRGCPCATAPGQVSDFQPNPRPGRGRTAGEISMVSKTGRLEVIGSPPCRGRCRRDVDGRTDLPPQCYANSYNNKPFENMHVCVGSA